MHFYSQLDFKTICRLPKFCRTNTAVLLCFVVRQKNNATKYIVWAIIMVDEGTSDLAKVLSPEGAIGFRSD